MLGHSAAPLVGVLPTAIAIGTEAVGGSTDWATYGAQLGVGAVLVAFAVWLQDRLSRQSRADIAAERAAHEKTRELLYKALTERTPK